MLGEIDPIPNLMKYYGADLDECHLPFNFHLLFAPWEASVIREKIDAYEAALPQGASPNWVLGNHDQPRVATRVGHSQVRVAQMLLLTLRGTPICYFGDEIGMANAAIPPNRLRDWNASNPADALRLSRDPQRTPMQWDATANAGFSPVHVEPWLPLPRDHDRVNVAYEEGDPRSVLALFRRLAALRRAMPALNIGTYRSVAVPTTSDVVAYERRHENTRALVALNFRAEPQTLDLSASARQGEVLLSTELDREGQETLAPLHLRPNEGLILSVE
jgi:alpha-glucosidase